MNATKKSEHITPVGGNVFADLGFSADEAAALQNDTKRMIAEKSAIKDYLMAEVYDWIQEQHLMHVDAADALGVTKSRVSEIVKRNSAGFSIDSLIQMLIRAKKRIIVTVT